MAYSVVRLFLEVDACLDQVVAQPGTKDYFIPVRQGRRDGSYVWLHGGPYRPGVNVMHCECGRSWRFRRVTAGHEVLVYERRWPWSRPGWRRWGEWSSTIGKFRCRCGRLLVVR